MLPEDLKEKLMEVDSSREKRLEIAYWITKNLILFVKHFNGVLQKKVNF